MKNSFIALIALISASLLNISIAVFGVLCYLAFLLHGWEQYKSLSWQEVNCDYISFPAGTHIRTYQATYRYTIDGKSYSSQTLFPKYASIFSEGPKYLCDRIRKLQSERQTITCFVNPQVPQQSVLSRGGVDLGATLMMAVFGFVISGLSVYFYRAVSLPCYHRFLALIMRIKDRKPWHTNLEWINGSMRRSRRSSVQLFIIYGFAGLPLIPPCFIEIGLALSSPVPNYYAYFGYLFLLLPIGAFALGAKYYSQWQRYGDSVLRLVTMPGVIGGRFVGHLQIDKQVHAVSGFHMRLRCEELVFSQGKKVSEIILWETDQTITRGIQSEEASGTSVPIVIHLPYGLPCTEALHSERICRWLLTIKTMSDGEPYSTEFEIPIFTTDESNPHYIPVREFAEDQIHEQDSLILLEEAGIAFEEIGTKYHLKFTFPKYHNFEQTAYFFVLLGIVYAIVFGIAHFFDFGFTYALGIVELIIFYCLLDLFLFHSVVEVEPGKLTIWRGWFYLDQGQEIHSEVIQSLDTGASVFWLTDRGQVSLYATFKSGRYIVLAKRVGSEYLANKIIQMMDKILRIKRREILP